jgi:hypothetical protein
MKIGLVSAVVTAALVLSTTALAQTPASAPKIAPPAVAAAPAPPASGYIEQHLEGNQVVTFEGDPLKGDENGSSGITVLHPPRVLRAQLIRPRVNFVSELLKSVENL